VSLLSLLISSSKRELESMLFAEYDFCVQLYCVMHTAVMQECLTFKVQIGNAGSEILLNSVYTSVVFVGWIFSI